MRTTSLRLTLLTSSMMLGLAIGAAHAAPFGANMAPRIVRPHMLPPGPGRIMPLRRGISLYRPTYIYDDTPHQHRMRRKVWRSLKDAGATTSEPTVHHRRATRTVKAPAQLDRGRIAPGHAAIVPLPGAHPLPNADLVDKANQGRDGQTIRDAGEALRHNGVVTSGSGASGGLLGDPLHSANPEAAGDAFMTNVNAIRQRFGLGPIGRDDSRYWRIPGRGGGTKDDPFGTNPGRLPGFSAASDGSWTFNPDGSATLTYRTGDGTRHRETYSSDGRRTSHRTDESFSDGSTMTMDYSNPNGLDGDDKLSVTITHPDGSRESSTGDTHASTTTYQAADGTVQTKTVTASGTVVTTTRTPDGETSGTLPAEHEASGGGGEGEASAPGSGSATLPGTDGGDAATAAAAAAWTRWWCSKSGNGCNAPVSIGEVKAGGSRGRPSGDDGASNSPGTGPTIDARRSIAVNPDTNATGGGGAPTSARTFDGGKLVNPGPAPAPSVVPPR